METKLNIAEILKDKPKGTKLYSPLFGDVYLSYVKDGIINVQHHVGITKFFGDGRYYNYPESEPLLFPSKEMRDWNKFAWKKGDMLVNKDRDTHVIFEEFTDDTYTTFTGKHYRSKISKNGYEYVRECSCATEEFTLETEDAAQTYIKTIEEKLGDKLNRETLEIEKQPEFKDGDIVFVESPMLGIDTNFMIAIFRKEKEIGKYKFSLALYKSNEHDTYLRENPVVLSPSDIKTFRLATEEEKQQLFDALAKRGKAWDAEKKQIVDLKPKVELKPFDKVLVRDSKSDYWRATLFSHINENGCYCCMWASWSYCIPYEGNESLLGTTKDVEDKQ